MCQRRELIALFSKMISKSACCWSFRVFFCLLQVGLVCCRLCLTLTRWVISGCFLLVLGCFQVVSCLFQVFSGCCRLFFRLFLGRFLLVVGCYRLFQVVSCSLQVISGCFLFLSVPFHGFKNQKPWYTFFLAPNNMFAYMVVHLTFCAPQILDRARMYANVYLVVHILQRQKYFRVEGKLKAYSTHHPPGTQSGYSDCFSQRRKQQAGLLSTQNQTTRQLSVNSV